MGMRTIAGLAAAAITFAAPAQASRWIESASGKNATVFYDADTVQRSGSYLVAWEKWENKPNPTRKEAVNKAQKEYDCAGRRSRLINSVNYREDGTVISSFTWEPYEQTWTAATPDSIGEAMLEAVCGSLGMSAASPPPG